jgi:c-di-GMP-binding flagellar brake protein YcgR|tara:strand:+ start:2986 stop:3324 length:339 start_codon:yes stop_codon:yes gene_type:complete
MKERRKFPRVAMKRGIVWRTDNTLDNLDRGYDISEGGVCLDCANVLDADDVVHLEFYLPTKSKIYAKAKVKWVKSVNESEPAQRTGFEFSDMSDPLKHEIRHFVGVCRYGCD